LKVVTEALERYGGEIHSRHIFNGLLNTFLDLTCSEYGFIGEVISDSRGRPCLRSYATTNIAWDEETQRLYQQAQEKGMIFSRLDCLYGVVLGTGNLIISNDPAHDSRSCGLPPGHPPLYAFMGIPLHGRQGLIGMVGLANRPGGYDADLARRLTPFLVTCGSLLQAHKDSEHCRHLERELARCRVRLEQPDKLIELGNGYRFDSVSMQLQKDGHPVLLTQKESDLLGILVENLGRIVPYVQLEEQIWRNVVVGESSLRSLLKRLRTKAPGLPIETVRGVGLVLENL
jgi:hypothetical protein